MSNIHKTASGDMKLSGAMLLTELARDPLLREEYPLLAEACSIECEREGSDTLAQRLAPATRCQRTANGVECVLSRTSTCVAFDPSSDLHAILLGGPCWHVFQSATGIALLALEASVEVAENELMSVEEFLSATRVNGELENGGAPRAVLNVTLTAPAARGFQRLLRATPAAGDRHHISVAAVQRVDGDVRLVLGGVAPSPYRVYTSVEEETMAGGLDEDTIAGLAERALLDAEFDPRSSDRVEAAAALLRDAITQIAASSP